MKVHEYQGKHILKGYGVPVPEGKVAFDSEQAYQVAKELGGGVCVVKAQIHAGGRGKGGGVKIAKNADEAKSFAEQILGMDLITHQTGPEGQKVRKVLVEQGMDIARELYLGVVLDRGTGQNVIMASTEGGMEIEEVAANTPEKIHKVWIDPAVGLQGYQLRNLAFGLGLSGKALKGFLKLANKLYSAYQATDSDLAEINPLVITGEDDVIALDAKMNFDDNALFRHQDILEMRDLDEEDALEVEASNFSLNYIRLDGNIGCMVNGAGLAMGTMDIIKLAGGEPANFLDVGGGANAEQVKNAMRILLSDENVKGVLINIFGGIMRCDIIAEGVISALKEIEMTVPLVVRLQGTNAEEGSKMLDDSGLDLHAIGNLADAAKKVVELSVEGK